jgi:hypothetical protein
MKVLRLRNETDEPEAMVTLMFSALQDLMNENTTLFYELVMKCREPGYQLSKVDEGALKDLAFIPESGRIHDTIRNIVLSATEGEGLSLRIVSPLATT